MVVFLGVLASVVREQSMLGHNRVICGVLCLNRREHLRGSSRLKQGSLSMLKCSWKPARARARVYEHTCAQH